MALLPASQTMQRQPAHILITALRLGGGCLARKPEKQLPLVPQSPVGRCWVRGLAPCESRNPRTFTRLGINKETQMSKSEKDARGPRVDSSSVCRGMHLVQLSTVACCALPKVLSTAPTARPTHQGRWLPPGCFSTGRCMCLRSNPCVHDVLRMQLRSG